MPTLDDVLGAHTGLAGADREWLHLLVADWQLLADLSFADLVLWVPTRDGGAFVAAAQMRPTTGPTVYHDDLVGDLLQRGRRLQVDVALDERRICRELDPEWRADVPVREETIPVVRAGRAVAVVSRHTNLAAARTPSRLELTYLQGAADLAQMIAEGRFPFAAAQDVHAALRAAPRVGDGLIRLDPAGTVSYASPNALSAYRRLGLTSDLVGLHLGRTTARLAPVRAAVEEALEAVVSGRAPRATEVEAQSTVLVLRAVPLRPGGRAVGALVLVRDVSELRRRERELVTKDATIREIHHRVKNNLQTVAALLRLQARRLDAPATRDALAEAGRRVAAIALVHEALSVTPAEQVDFDEVADRVASMLGDLSGSGAPGADVVVHREGSFGTLPAQVATSLALVLTELVSNAVEHGLAGAAGVVTLRVERSRTRLRLVVLDTGRGRSGVTAEDAQAHPPAGLTGQQPGGLGLQIVRTLLAGDLAGRLELCAGPLGGVEAVVDLPLPEGGVSGSPGD